MSSVSLSTATRVWAQALVDLGTVPKEKLNVLERVCNGAGLADKPSSSAGGPTNLQTSCTWSATVQLTGCSAAGDILQGLLPVVMFLQKSSGKYAGDLLQLVLGALQALPQHWQQQQTAPLQTQQDFTELMANCRWLLQSPEVPTSLKQKLSPALAKLHISLLSATAAVQDPLSSHWLKSGCYLLLRALTRSDQFTADGRLALLPPDAEQVLRWAAEHLATQQAVAPPAVQAAGSNGNVPAADSTGSKLMLLQDDKLYLVVLKLILTTYGDSSSSSSSSLRSGCLPPDQKLIEQFLSWSMSFVKWSLDDLMRTADDVGEGSVSREAAYAASQLAATCVHQLLVNKELTGKHGSASRQQLYDMVDVALSVAEASLALGRASAATLSAEADKALLLSARILAGITPFVAGLSSSSSATEQLELATRIKGLLLSAARLASLVKGPASKPEAPTGPVAALGWRLKAGFSQLRFRRLMAARQLTDPSVHAGKASRASHAALLGSVSLGSTMMALNEAESQAAVQLLDDQLQYPWNWDITQPLTDISPGISVTALPLTVKGWGPQLLLRSAAEVLVEALAASWSQGQPSAVRALLLLQVAPNLQEAMVTALTAGRLYTKLNADPALGQLLLPLLADPLTSSSACSPEMAGTLVCALEGMAAAAAARRDGAWVYRQAVQLLLKLYREPTEASLQLLAGRGANPGMSGLLADALESLAEALSNSPDVYRQQLRSELLLLFTDVGLRVGSSTPGHKGLQDTDLGELLPAVATAAEGLQPRTLRLLGASSSRMSMQEIQAAQREDASATRLFRNLWLYCALHQLVNPLTPLGSSAGGGKAASGGPAAAAVANQEWQLAAGRLAGVTPLLVVGTDNYIEADMVERLKVELGQQLAKAGKLGNQGSMLSALQQLVQPRCSLPLPGKDVLVAFIYAVSMAELSRAALAPLPDADEDGVLACPVSATLGYLQGVLPEGVASVWLGAIVARAFRLYLQRLSALEKAQMTGGIAEAPGLRPALAYAEQLAQALIQHLGDAAGAVDGSTPAVAALCSTLLGELLAAFPALHFSRPCYRALFAQLQREEGDLPMGQVQASGAGIVWERTKAWVQAAAELAPTTTEALLHSFICSSAIVGGQADTFLHNMSRATSLMMNITSRPESPQPNGSLANGNSQNGAGPHMLHHAGSSGSGGLRHSPSSGSGSREGLHASQAAFRRAADLLQICGAARSQQQWLGADGSYEGTLAFARKLHYSGAVAGLMQGGLEEEEDLALSSSDNGTALGRQQHVANQIVAHLEDLLQNPRTPQSALDDAHLSASALLAVEQHCFAATELGQRLLKDLCSAPLQRLTPATVKLAIFSWAWVSAEAPEVLVHLISSIASAWVWTVDQRRGLFSGQPHAARAANSSSGSSSSGSGVGGSTDGMQQPGAGDEPMLQAIAAHHVWLSYLLELWGVVSLLGDERSAAAQHKFARLLYVSLSNPDLLSRHPAAVGAYFRLLQLGLAFGRSQLRPGRTLSSQPVPLLLLFDQILKAALLWFASPPRYFARWTRSAAAEQVASLEQFMSGLAQVLVVTQGAWPSAFAGSNASGSGPSSAHPVWGVAAPNVSGYVTLLQFLCGEELKRLRTWTDPVGSSAHPAATPASAPWDRYVQLAWEVEPALAVNLLAHYPMAAAARRSLEGQVVKHSAETRVQKVPAAAALLVSAAQRHHAVSLRPLATWQPGAAELGLQLLSGEAGAQPDVRSFAIKCLFNEPPERVVFFLPQLVQLLRGDDGAIRSFFLTSARHSDLFAHQLMWALASEGRPPEEAFNPEVKRSGWQPPKDTGLWTVADELRKVIVDGMTPQQRAYWDAENSYFERVTQQSGYLYKFSKDERRAKLQEALATFRPPREDLYLPTNPDCRVVNHIPSSGACMQSAAKVPILVAFHVQPHTHPVDTSHPPPSTSSCDGDDSTPSALAPAKKMACIFKVGDDIRQDVLAIQVITLLRDTFERAGLGLYLRPYGCLPTGYECGIIEVVPNCKSRAALGELSDRGLYDIFTAEFGAPGSSAFERARYNFIVSEAAYAVASYLLQAKDRHNGNIMLDDCGHIVHIDFGFILEISPGGNLGFESAAFKLSHEMAQVLDPGGARTSPQFRLFEELVVRAYLAARTVAEPIIATVALMAGSGLPCFGRGAPVANLRQRFRLDLNDAQAAAFMRGTIADAYDKWTTGFYDYIQALQNKIPY